MALSTYDMYSTGDKFEYEYDLLQLRPSVIILRLFSDFLRAGIYIVNTPMSKQGNDSRYKLFIRRKELGVFIDN